MQFIEDHDGCQQSKQEPVLKLDINDEILWPVIAVQKVATSCLNISVLSGWKLQ